MCELTCGHCGSKFIGTPSQYRHFKYENSITYCSKVCRFAAARNKLSKPLPNMGPCKTCGKEFFSKTAKQYCNIDCYIKSEKHMEMRRSNVKHMNSKQTRDKIAHKLRKGEVVKCIECGCDMYKKKSEKHRKFCSKVCYRTHLSKRFDRWIANPEGMSLPQCYDEFLDREELSCVVEGCGWIGKHLTLHINQTHGIKADEFKRATGFNLSTGVISRSLSEDLSNRNPVGVAVDNAYCAHDIVKNNENCIVRYTSLEGIEHRKKARALASLSVGPQRTCVGCGKDFFQSTPFGKTIYCSKSCRNSFYRRTEKDRREREIS